MDEKVLQKLEFDRIIELLEKQCSSRLGKEKALRLKPSTDLETVNCWLAETSEAKEVLRLYPDFSLSGIRDIRPFLRRAEMGGVIEPQEFLEVLDTLVASRRIKGFFDKEGQKYRALSAYAAGLCALLHLEQEIKKTISPEGEVSDRASEELARIRKKLRSLQGKAKEKLEAMIASPAIQKYLQDPLITVRNGRYVVPVKQEFRQQVPGLVHDQSASGATLYIEPLNVVEITNDVQRYEAMERAEVVRILRRLTAQVDSHRQELQLMLQALSSLDFAFAKARLSAELDCGPPVMNRKGYLRIIQGRHPLIQGTVVPVTIWLGDEFDALVITGPNTGGKTVTLKTVGLLSLMAQAGLHVPAQVGTELAVFRRIYADIGDEQSIEQSLSTFSSHMTNIVDVLNNLDEQTLVLLDELGAGTDPAEGAALAMAILEHLIQKGTKVIATTHYSELKSFAYSRERVENACVEFDVETLRPTYRLLIGVPGRSNAFEISARLGLSPALVERARSFLSQEEVRAAELIASLETNQLLSERERQEAEKLKRIAEAKLSQIEKQENDLKRQAQAVLQKARVEALEIIARARRESEAMLKEAKEILKKAPQEAQEELHELRDRLREEEARIRAGMEKEDEEELEIPDDLLPGETVYLKRLNQKAQVLEKPKGDEVLVQAGIMKLAVKLKDLRRAEEEKEEKTARKHERTGMGEIAAEKARTMKNELDLRGMTVEEAVLEAEKYLDDAYLAGLPKAYIIHGKGTGALRGAIGEIVKKHRFVASYRMGGYYEGGHGVTVVEFKR